MLVRARKGYSAAKSWYNGVPYEKCKGIVKIFDVSTKNLFVCQRSQLNLSIALSTAGVYSHTNNIFLKVKSGQKKWGTTLAPVLA